MLQSLNLNRCSEHVGSTFRLYISPDQSLELRLAEARDLGSTPRQEQFSLLFQGSGHLLLQQAIYRVEHAELGQLDLFLVPVGKQPEGFLYQAVFNRLVKA